MVAKLGDDPSYTLRYKVRMGDIGAVRGLIKAGQADPLAPGETQRQFTALHSACWGSVKPENDKDIVEALLLYGQKSGIEEKMRTAKE